MLKLHPIEPLGNPDPTKIGVSRGLTTRAHPESKVMTSSIIFLRKDAHIGGFHKRNAKRATSADNSTELL